MAGIEGRVVIQRGSTVGGNLPLQVWYQRENERIVDAGCGKSKRKDALIMERLENYKLRRGEKRKKLV